MACKAIVCGSTPHCVSKWLLTLSEHKEAARPDIGAVTLALLFGLYSLISACRRSCWASKCAGPGVPCKQCCTTPPEPRQERGRPESAPAQRPLIACQAPSGLAGALPQGRGRSTEERHQDGQARPGRSEPR